MTKVLLFSWVLLPILGAFLIPRISGRGDPGFVLQESQVSYQYMGAIGGGWMLFGLALVPFLGLHGSSLAKMLLVVVGWSAAAGAWLGPAVVELRYQPPASAVGEPVEFLPSGHAGHMVDLSPTSGDAASAKFRVPQQWWNPLYARAGNKAIKGRVFKSGRNLWFARFD